MANAPEIVLPPLAFKAAGNSDTQRDVNLARVLRSPGYPTLVLLMADAVTKWADRVVLDFTAQQVTVKYQVDGIWTDMPPMDRPTGDFMLATLKQLCNLDYLDRESRQEASITGQLDSFKYKFHIRCQGVPTGERVQIRVDLPRPQPAQLIEMGMREKAHERVRQMLKRGKGLLVSAALPGDGASMSWKGLRAAGDRFMSDFVTFEQKGAIEDDVINVGSVVYDSEEAFPQKFRELLLKEPDTIFFSQVRSPQIMRQIVESGLSSNRLMVVQIDARSAVEAIYRLQILGVTSEEIQQHLIGVVAHRSMRRLCVKCREPFEPDPNVLAKLGIPVGRVRQFYKQFDPAAYTTLDSKGNPIPPPVCPTCGGTGYFARVGLFEVLENDATLQTILKARRKYADAVQAWRAAGNPTFRDEGLALLALGVSSIEELQRVLKS
ncbi:MAG: Flp pilus assembly complex ATPase component TadA [Planctomycetaceae bacterium]|nr:Flp pilus assembly complex ATPase component TadA [Planctomycetaceae bacterium]